MNLNKIIRFLLSAFFYKYYNKKLTKKRLCGILIDT